MMNDDPGSKSENRIDVDKPLWNQDTYFGRWMHYAFITDCCTILVPESKLWEAKKLCEDYKWVAIIKLLIFMLDLILLDLIYAWLYWHYIDKFFYRIIKNKWRICFRLGKEPEGLQRKDIIYAKKLKDGAFHPDNDELMHVVGRMSFQLPGSIALTAAMLTFYKLIFYK